MSSVDSFIGRRIRQFRWVRGITQADLARRMSVDLEQIKTFENGTSRVGAEELFQISEAMNVPVTAFFEGMGVLPGSGQTGTREDLTSREARLLSHFKGMSDRQQDAILNMSQTFAEQLRQPSQPLRDSNVVVPGTARRG